MSSRLALGFCAIMLLAGCATRPAQVGAPGDIPVYVITHGWHTGVAMRTADVDFAPWPKLPLPATRYLEVGWGDRDFYPAPGFNLWYAFKALAWPTPGVLHVVGFDEPPARRFPQSEVLELRLARAAFDRLLSHIGASFEPNPAPIAPGLYARGAFYPSRDEFHLSRTCNVWVAQALRAAHVDIAPALTTEGLLAQLRPIAARCAGESCALP